MEHFNPILGSEPNGQKFITCGEIMLRLTPPNYEKIRMASGFEASYGGSEANIALALANLGVDSTFFSVVPNNSLGKSAVRWLRSNDVHCTPMILTEPDETPSNRLGTYYLETGYGIRASKVIYDRKHSAITEYDFSQVDLDALLAVYASARAYMCLHGNPSQWGGDYPSPALLEEDIRRGRLYVDTDERGAVHGAFAFLPGDDPTYARIEGGSWLSDAPYGVIHRVASDGRMPGVFRRCAAFCRARCANLRIDTHHDNHTMQRLIEGAGFRRCGVIYVEDGSPRIAYQTPCP